MKKFLYKAKFEFWQGESFISKNYIGKPREACGADSERFGYFYEKK